MALALALTAALTIFVITLKLKQGPTTTAKVKWCVNDFSWYFYVSVNEYLCKNNQNIVYYLSCQAVRRTAYLNFCSGCT